MLIISLQAFLLGLSVLNIWFCIFLSLMTSVYGMFMYIYSRISFKELIKNENPRNKIH